MYRCRKTTICEDVEATVAINTFEARGRNSRQTEGRGRTQSIRLLIPQHILQKKQCPLDPCSLHPFVGPGTGSGGVLTLPPPRTSGIIVRTMLPRFLRNPRSGISLRGQSTGRVKGPENTLAMGQQPVAVLAWYHHASISAGVVSVAITPREIVRASTCQVTGMHWKWSSWHLRSACPRKKISCSHRFRSPPQSKHGDCRFNRDAEITP